MAFGTATTLPSPTGARLRLYCQEAKGRPRAVVQINHGLAEHAARYAEFATFLSQEGFTVYAHDHRGHGHTVAADAPLGSFGAEPAAEKVLADAEAVHDHIEARHPDLPVIIFGHSMGAMIALAFLMRRSSVVRAAALWNMPLASPLTARAAKAVLAWERFRLGSDVPSRLLPRLTFAAWARAIPGARTPFDWLSRDTEEVARYVADPLCGFSPTVGMWQAVFDINLMAADMSGLAKIPRALPLQLVSGAADPATAGGKIIRALGEKLRGAGFSRVSAKVYAGTRHESLKESNRTLIMDEFVRWASGALSRT